MAGEREGETERQSCTFHSHVVQEVRNTVHNVVKELQRDRFSCLYTWELSFLLVC